MRRERPIPIDRVSSSAPSGLLAWVAGPSDLAKVVRFGLIGGISTLIYVAMALLLSSSAGAGLDAAPASVAAYLTGAVFSYCGHRAVTFMSDGTVAFEVARFAAATAAGLAFSTLLASALTDLAGLPFWIPVVLASTIVPVMNFIIFRNYVFISRARCTS